MGQEVCVWAQRKHERKEKEKEEALVKLDFYLEEAQANTSILDETETWSQETSKRRGNKMKVQKYIVTTSFFSARK